MVPSRPEVEATVGAPESGRPVPVQRGGGAATGGIQVIPFQPYEPDRIGEQTDLDLLATSPQVRSRVRDALYEVLAAEGPVEQHRLARLTLQRFGFRKTHEERRQAVLALVKRELIRYDRHAGSFVWPPGLEIELPFLGHLYTAVAGRGAYRDRHRIRASQVSRLYDAVVTLGDYGVGASAARNPTRLALTAALAEAALRLRLLGSAAVDLAWLAEGTTDATIFLSNKPWDTAAGVVIAREAGAVVVDLDGTDHTIDSGATIAAAPGIIEEFLQVVQSATASTESVPGDTT